jgi:hypothetical protein
VYRKKFADFVGIDFNHTETLYIDDNVACFLSNIGKETEFKVVGMFAYFNLTRLNFLATYLEGMQGSIAVNSGVDSVVISKSTKYKDIRMISKYSHCDDETKMITLATVALAANKDEKNNNKRKFEGDLL